MKANIILLLLLGIAGQLYAASVQFSELPPAVQRTVNAQVGAAGIESIQRITRNGIPLYEVRFSQSGKRPFYVSESGSVIRPENVISADPARDGTRKVLFAELPAPVQNAIRGQAGTATIEDIDMVTKSGRTTYEAAFKREGENVELVVDSNGNILRGAQAIAISQARVPLAAATKVTFNDLPVAAQNALRSAAKGAAIEDIDKGTLQGKTVYEAAFKHNGANVELRVGEDGTLVRDDVNDKYLAQIGELPTGPSGIPETSWQAVSDRVPLTAASKVNLRQLPAAVRDTLRTYAGTSPIEDIDQGTLNGQTVYQAAFKHQGRHTELRVAENGSLVKDRDNERFLARFTRQGPPGAVGRPPSWESLTGGSARLGNAETVRWNDLPPAVQTTLRSQAGAAAIDRIEKGTLNGRMVYQGAFKRDGRTMDVRIAEDGSLLR